MCKVCSVGNCPPPASGFGALVWVALCEVVECARALDSMRALDSVLFESWLCVCESVGVDSVNALDCESALDSALASESIWLDSVNVLDSAPPRFCVFSFFRISLDSVSCASFRISALDSVIVFESVPDSVCVFDSESALDFCRF